MSYPLSSAVSAGDATEASQYNNLRLDALYLGNDSAASGTLLQLLASAMGEISLTWLSYTSVRLNASESEPCGLMIGGVICAVTDNVQLTLDPTELINTGRYFIYAVDLNDGHFTLAAGTAAPSHSRTIGTFLWDGSGMIPQTLHTMKEYEAIQAVKKPSIANGRLTLASGVPVPDSDVQNATVLYFTPYGGNEIALYVGNEWETFSFSEMQLSLSGLTRELPYDIFISASRSGLELSAMPWGSASARLSPLVTLDGVRVLTSDYGKRYIGSVCLNSSGYCEDSITGRLVWNENNRVERPLLSQMLASSGSVSYATNTWVPYWNTYAPVVRILAPVPDAAFEIDGVGMSEYISENDQSMGYYAAIGIGCDDTSSNIAPVGQKTWGNGPVQVSLRNHGTAFRGYHTYTLIFYTNYMLKPVTYTHNSVIGEYPGLYGSVMG